MRFFGNFWLISGFFWKTKKGLIALLILFFCICSAFFGVGLSIYLNAWNADFYNAIQNYDKPELIRQLVVFSVIISLMMANYFISYFVEQFYIIFVRKPITQYYTKNWLYTKSYLACSGGFDNPEERMDYDVERFISVSQTLFLGIVRNISSVVSFSIILWGLSGNISFSFLDAEIVVHGYLFWIAIILGLLNVFTVFKIGKPLKKLIYDKQKYEANFRYHLSSIRNNKSAISDSGSEKYEYLVSRRNLSNIITNFYGITFRTAKINLVTMLFQQTYSIIGVVLTLPKYFAKELNFGQMMQVNSALVQVIYPIVYFAFIYESIAELNASMSRLVELKKRIDGANIEDKLTINLEQKELVHVENVSLLESSSGRELLQNVNFNLHANESIFLRGDSGVGKTSLLRVIANKNENFSGKVSFNVVPRILFLMHKPYFPEGDFKRAVFYPNLSSVPSDEDFIQILRKLNLGYLERFINTRYDWRNVLSSGEQQKLAFCRIFTQEYDILLLDEATTNVDLETEKLIYEYLHEQQIAFVSVSHYQRVSKYHDKTLELV